MTGGRCNLDRGGGGRGGRRHNQNKPNRDRGRYRDAPECRSPGPQPVQINQPPSPQLGGAAPPPDQPPPQHGNEGLIRVRGCGLGEFCLSISVQWWARLLISLSYSLGE